MSTQTGPSIPEGQATLTVASRSAGYLRGGGILVPLVTIVLAFTCGGVIIAMTGANPLSTYKAIFDGTGFNWLLPWVTGEQRTIAAQYLQQTLLLATPLILVGLSVALAFRAGLFNIGGQGQYLVGSMAAVWFGSQCGSLPMAMHVGLALTFAAAAGALWGAIAGFLRAATGANEVISTIMLNWIALWLGMYLIGVGGPLQSKLQKTVPISHDIAPSAHLPVIWGDPLLQGLHAGIFVAVVAVLLFGLLIRRSVAGFEIRALGFNPEAAQYAGIHVRRNYVQVMAVCGIFAGIAGGLDVLGWEFRLASNDIQASTIGFLGIAVALLGRNSAGGVLLSALLFGALMNGTSVRNLDPELFAPQLASNLTLILQGLIVLLVSAPVIVAGLGRLRYRRKPTLAIAPANPTSAPDQIEIQPDLLGTS